MKNILDYLEQTAMRYPEKTAVDDGELCLTWQELLNRSKCIGTALCKRLDRQKPVVILAEKSAVTLSAMLGVVYAGCFYVMADPGQPAERLREIFHTLSPAMILILAQEEELLEQTGYGERKCILDEILNQDIDEKRLAEIREGFSGDELLYGTFTSGSTGVPKGIVVSHQSVIDFISHFINTFGFSEADIIGNQAPFDFDVSVKDIYTCVLTGAKLVVIRTKLFSTPPLLLDYLCDKHVNTLIWAVSALTLISALRGLEYRIPSEVKRVMFSGEVMPVKQLRLWQKALPGAQFVNLYGPSEITCNCTYYRVERTYEDDEVLPLGRAFEGRRVFLLDEEGKQIEKAGQTGEICVSGESLAAGYYHNPEETKKKFRQMQTPDGTQRYYCTGDLGYFSASGELFFCGRKDFQIKHMGHRIELEEIEHAINQLKGVENSCCVVNIKRNRLIGFYFGTAKEQEIRSGLKKKLPQYMIPYTIIRVDHMSLNKNGKTDRDYFRNRKEVVM